MRLTPLRPPIGDWGRSLKDWMGAVCSQLAELARNTPMTGEVKYGFWTAAPTGFVFLSGGTIGDGSSSASVRANSDCHQLFVHLWNNLADAQAPVVGGRGTSAEADWSAHKKLTLPDHRQRVPMHKAASGTGATLGGTGGAIDHTHNTKKHFHGMGAGADLNITASGAHPHAPPSNAFVRTGTGLANFNTTGSGTLGYSNTTATDGAHPHPAGNFAGRIGIVTGGVDGNADQATTTNNQAFIVLSAIIAL